MIITSLNLLQSSESNEEFGVVLDRSEQAYLDAAAEVERIITGSISQNLITTRISAALGSLIRGPASGFCIRCSASIPLDPERPYCGGCFKVWAKFENPDFAEKVCHRCGQSGRTSRAKPECYRCFSRS